MTPVSAKRYTLAERLRIHRRAKALLARKPDWDESKHPRDEDGRWTDAGGGAGNDIVPPGAAPAMSHEDIQTSIKWVAKALDFPADRIGIDDGEHPFELNGKSYQAAGIAFTQTIADDAPGKNLILLYSKQLKPAYIAGVIAHEIEHIKFATALRRYIDEAVMTESGEVNPDGSLKPPYDKKYPAYKAMHDAYYGRDIKDFAVSDGVSDYSYEWWKNWKTKTAEKPGVGPAYAKAVHETLSEMARIKYETGNFPDHMGEHIISWRGEDVPRPPWAQIEANAKIWRDLYRAVEKVWKLK